MSKIMQVLRLSPGNMGYIIQIIQIIQIRNLSALKYLDHQVGIDHTDHLSDVWMLLTIGFRLKYRVPSRD